MLFFTSLVSGRPVKVSSAPSVSCYHMVKIYKLNHRRIYWYVPCRGMKMGVYEPFGRPRTVPEAKEQPVKGQRKPSRQKI